MRIMPEIKSHPCLLAPSQIQPHLPLFIFLPGMDGTGQLLRSQTSSLEQAFDVRCLAIPPDDLNDWETLSQQVIELIQAELQKNRDRAVYLCGESFGACLAQKIMVRLHSHPESLPSNLVARLILVNPASSFNQRPWIRWGTSVSQYFPEVFYRLSAVALMPFLAILNRLAEPERQALWDAMSSVPQRTSVWRIDLLRNFDITPTQLQKITQPTLLIAGASDRLLPSVWEVTRLQSLLPNAEVVVLPQSGHACLLETDTNLYNILQTYRFLEERDKVLSAPTRE